METNVTSVAGEPRPVPGEVAGIDRSTMPAPVKDRVTADLARLRKTTGQIAGSVFFGTMLATMRESGMKGRYGHGGRGEEAFSAQLHGILAERAGAAKSGSVADQLYRRLERQQSLISKSLVESRASSQ